MKKFFAIAIIAATFAACNNSGDKKPAEDTTKPATIDTPAAPVVVDTTKPAVVDSPAAAAVDTTKK